MKVVIVGGVAGGATAAARIRRLDERAEIVGYECVDKRIDVLTTAIHAGLKAPQLKNLDLAYTPPIPPQRTLSTWQAL